MTDDQSQLTRNSPVEWGSLIVLRDRLGRMLGRGKAQHDRVRNLLTTRPAR